MRLVLCSTLFPFSWKSGRNKVAGVVTSDGRTASVGDNTNTLQSEHCFMQTGISK
ncbi:MAG: hypothetical protein GY705_29075 [Bacteroidetes bacterium]|nr:hypothetical protein [Bacteroidota bacterium]